MGALVPLGLPIAHPRMGARSAGVGEDFHEMAVGVVEVHAAAAEAVIDLVGVLAVGVGVEARTARADALEDRVELSIVDPERVVLRGNGFRVHEVEGPAAYLVPGIFLRELSISALPVRLSGSN